VDNQRSQQFGGSWTADKLQRVRKYLSAYTVALSKQPFHLQYIDAFAGTGYCGKPARTKLEAELFQDLSEPSTQEFLKGSARIALEIEPSFDSFIFIDNDPANCAELTNLKNEFPEKREKITIVNEDANTCLQGLAKLNWRSNRAVLFLDPYAMQVEWQTVKAIAQTEAIDMWYLFPLAATNRLLRRDAEISSAWRDRLNLVFGSDDWEQAFYERRTRLTLFGEDETTVKTADTDAIKEYLLERLGAEFAGVARNPLLLTTERNVPLFLLCFAAANKKGAPIAIRMAEHILKG
jgi:three-Cys-motif partner protein